MTNKAYLVLTPKEERQVNDAINQARLSLMCVGVSPAQRESVIKALREAKELFIKKEKSRGNQSTKTC